MTCIRAIWIKPVTALPFSAQTRCDHIRPFNGPGRRTCSNGGHAFQIAPTAARKLRVKLQRAAAATPTASTGVGLCPAVRLRTMAASADPAPSTRHSGANLVHLARPASPAHRTALPRQARYQQCACPHSPMPPAGNASPRRVASTAVQRYICRDGIRLAKFTTTARAPGKPGPPACRMNSHHPAIKKRQSEDWRC